MNQSTRKIELVEVNKLRHIEGYGKKRIIWLSDKIRNEGYWTMPLKLSNEHCLIYNYNEVKVWSLRKNQKVDSNLIIKKALSGDIYPYKTAKHSFPDGEDIECKFTLNELREK